MRSRKRHLLHDYACRSSLTVVFLVTLAGGTVSGWFEYASDQAAHGQPATVIGEDGYLPVISEQVFQNWQSEFLALATLIALGSVLVHRGSPESKDTQVALEQRVADLSERIDRLVDARTSAETRR